MVDCLSEVRGVTECPVPGEQLGMALLHLRNGLDVLFIEFNNMTCYSSSMRGWDSCVRVPKLIHECSTKRSVGDGRVDGGHVYDLRPNTLCGACLIEQLGMLFSGDCAAWRGGAGREAYLEMKTVIRSGAKRRLQCLLKHVEIRFAQ